MQLRAKTILFGMIFVLSWTAAGNAALKIDFTQTGGPVEAGYQGYYADHESAATFTERSYSAFGTTIWVAPIWPGNPARQAMQMIERSSGSALVIDWIGTDARVTGADPLVLGLSGLPAGAYAWTSYHHDPQDQTGLFDVTITDAAGSMTVTDIDISDGALAADDMTRFETTIVSDGVNLVALSFENQGYSHVPEAFFVMNALVLESLDSGSDVLGVDDVPEWRAGEIDGSGVMISEFLASNRDGLADGDGNTPDWVELYNNSAESVSLDGWCLTDSEDDLGKWPFPPGTVLRVGGYLVVFGSSEPEDDYVDQKGWLHTNFALDKDGEYLALVDDSGSVVHEFAPAYPVQQADTSYGMWQGQPRYFETPTPGSANRQPFLGLTAQTSHSPARGFYDQPFELEISCETPDVTIRYTLDGTEPTEQTRRLYDPNEPILITTTTHVRSLASKPGWRSAPVITHTYIFVDDVAQQPTDPPDWPTDWGHSSDAGAIVPADYEMDPRVVNSTLPGYSVREALFDIPTVSISMGPDDFISDATGIYANSQSRWERKCSVEYILPDGGKGFQYDCKVEVHGNASRRPYRMQKHSLRLTFTSQYGPAKLDYPLFPDSEVEKFNQLVLRASFTDSWGLVSWSSSSRYRPNDSQYIRDVWMKDSLGDMGQPSSHGKFVHLYVNGLYFGIHNLTPAGYAQMQEVLDIENFADYMLLHFYADAEDWPHHNGYAAVNAISGDGRYRFFVWDQEIVLDYHGRAAARINSSGGAGAVFQKMRASTEFRLLFADRVYKHCFNDGALSVAASQQRYLKLANEIDKAIVAESARWGDTQMTTPYGNAIEQPRLLTDINDNVYPPAPHGPDYYFTREDSWVVERDNVIDNYIPAIHDTANSYALVNVLRARSLYPNIDPPVFQINETDQHGGLVASGDTLTMANPNGGGTIYYTLDGTDPRAPKIGGTLNAQTLVAEDAAKAVWVPTSDIGLSWTGGAEPFDDSGWTSGTPAAGETSGGIGYERNTGYESFIAYDVEAEMYGNVEACYIRILFTVSAQDLADFNYMKLRMRFDDGFVAYLNGTPIASANAPASPAWNSGATDSHSDMSAISLQTFDGSVAIDTLQVGDNILAIHGMNAGQTSSDFLISAELTAGEDARSGDLSPSAASYSDPIALTGNTQVKARLWDNGQWSALNEAVYTVSP